MTDTDHPSNIASDKRHHVAAEIRRNRRFIWAMTGLLFLVVAVVVFYAFYCGRSSSPTQNQKRQATDQNASSLMVINGSGGQSPATQMSLQPAPMPEPGSAAASDIDAPPAVANPASSIANSTASSAPAARLQGAAQLTDVVMGTPKKLLDTTCQLYGVTCTR